MSLRLIFNLISISGLFGKKEDLDILPPPPPFPEIGKEDKSIDRGMEGEKQSNKQKEKEINEKRKAEEKERKSQEKELEKKRKLQEKVRIGKRRARKKRIFNFFHNIGFVKTEKEKREIENRRQKRFEIVQANRKKREEEIRKQGELKFKEQESKRRKDEEEKRKGEEERKRAESEKQKEKDLKIERIKNEERKKHGQIERQRRETERREERELKKQQKESEKKEKQEIEIKEKEEVELEEIKPIKKKPFSGIFGKKKADKELEKELKEIEEIKPVPSKKKVKEEKTELTELDEIGKDIKKPGEVKIAEEEIQKAIRGIKTKKKPSIVKKLFMKKEKPKEIIEKPELMPRTYDKIDHVVLIEERIHKARLSLMDFKFDEAKRIYIDIMRSYNELDAKQKGKVYQDIKDLYYERKSAEKFAK